MTIFLYTRSGYIAAHAIDQIEHDRPAWPEPYCISYHVGTEARETRATEADVQDFWEQLSDSNS